MLNVNQVVLTKYQLRMDMRTGVAILGRYGCQRSLQVELLIKLSPM